MSKVSPAPATNSVDPPMSRARASLLKRLADVVCLPSSRINAFERSMTADLLVELLREASLAERQSVARRLTVLNAPPGGLVRLLLRDEPSVAGLLLEAAVGLTDADLIACLYQSSPEHRRLIAQRREVSQVVCDALVDMDEEAVTDALLRNEGARFSHQALEHVVVASRDAPHRVALLLRRPELRPSHAFALFWWADAEARRALLKRFSVSRDILQDAVDDLFVQASAEAWRDPLSGKALDFIEPRQRCRDSAGKSVYGDLGGAAAAAEAGMTRELADEIAYLAGLKPMTCAKIFADPGGEPLAILCKATGLRTDVLRALWRGLGRPEPDLRHGQEIYETIAVDGAQTVLRYWNWSAA